MQFFPARDIKRGECVRLYGVKLINFRVLKASPLAAARKYNLSRTSWLRMVGLDGAGALRIVSVIASVVKSVGCRGQIGGGVRALSAVRQYLLLGAAGVVLGASALTGFRLISGASRRVFGRAALSLDAIGGCVALRARVLAELARLGSSVLA